MLLVSKILLTDGADPNPDPQPHPCFYPTLPSSCNPPSHSHQERATSPQAFDQGRQTQCLGRPPEQYVDVYKKTNKTDKNKQLNKYISTCSLARISWLKRAKGGIAPGRLGRARGPMLWSGVIVIFKIKGWWCHIHHKVPSQSIHVLGHIIFITDQHHQISGLDGIFQISTNCHNRCFHFVLVFFKQSVITWTGAGGAGFADAASFLLIVWPSPVWCCRCLYYPLLFFLLLLFGHVMDKHYSREWSLYLTKERNLM